MERYFGPYSSSWAREVELACYRFSRQEGVVVSPYVVDQILLMLDAMVEDPDPGWRAGRIECVRAAERIVSQLPEHLHHAARLVARSADEQAVPTLTLFPLLHVFHKLHDLFCPFGGGEEDSSELS